MHFKKLKTSVSATSEKSNKVVHKNRYTSFSNSDDSYPQPLRPAQKVVQQQCSNHLLSQKQMVSINAVHQKHHKSSNNFRQKQHVTKKEETKVELKMSKQQSTKMVIHKQTQNGSSKQSRLRRALARCWKRVREAFRAAFCCHHSSSSCCRKSRSAYVKENNSPTSTDEDDIDAAFERYKRQVLASKSGNATSGGLSSSETATSVAYDELTPSQRNTIKKLHKNKFWNWNDSVKSTSDKFLECLELDDISCGEASLRKKFTTIARRKQITAFCEDRAILGEIEIGLAALHDCYRIMRAQYAWCERFLTSA